MLNLKADLFPSVVTVIVSLRFSALDTMSSISFEANFNRIAKIVCLKAVIENKIF